MTAGDVTLVGAATGRVLETLREGLDRLGEPSPLPGWTRAHVATHLARNADSFTWLLDGARVGERREQYPGGPATRAAAIEAGSARPAEEVVADVERAAARLAAAWARMDDASWSGQVGLSAGDVPARELVWARLREVEVHHTDLGLGYEPHRWAAEFVDRELPRRIEGLTARLPRGTAVRLVRTGSGQTWEFGAGPASVTVTGPGHAILAWALGRDAAGLDAPAGLPPLAPW
jgi:maleylpyruvate isomerase